jgi:hypothetical protein
VLGIVFSKKGAKILRNVETNNAANPVITPLMAESAKLNGLPGTASAQTANAAVDAIIFHQGHCATEIFQSFPARAN